MGRALGSGIDFLLVGIGFLGDLAQTGFGIDLIETSDKSEICSYTI